MLIIKRSTYFAALSVLLIIVLFSSFHKPHTEVYEVVKKADITNDNYALSKYQSLACPELNYTAFSNALRGYYQLNSEEKLNNDSIITVIDFEKSSKQERLFVINHNQNVVVIKSLVAHGKNTGIEYATKFSNKKFSLQSSTGFYITKNTYIGKHGYSLRLQGLEKGINDNALDRAIVIHPAKYATNEFVKKYGRLGRSFGCPALPPEISKKTIELIKDGSLLYIFHPNYNKSTILPSTKSLVNN